jgi:plastocyanin
MRRVVLAVTVVLAALGGPAASATMDEPSLRVSVEFSSYEPSQLNAIVGDTVTWTNVSVRAHTVTADDDSYDSGRMVTGDVFSHQFDAPGEYAYHCTFHPFIRGDVNVYMLLLDPPQSSAAPGRSFPLTGRAALAPGTKVQIESDTGSGFQPVASAFVKPDGHYTALVTPTSTARYRAVSGDQVSPPVDLIVLDHTVQVTPSRRGSGYTVLSRVSPADAGAPVVLQLRLRDRFGWWPVARARLGRDSTARLFVRSRRRVPARVLLTLPDGATPLAISPTFTVGSSRRRAR